MKLDKFNSIAPYYDRLGAIVFGKSIRKSQTIYFDQIPTNARVLVIGGGTGWWLEQLQKNNPHGKICFIEASSEMLKRARKKSLKNVVFIHGTEESVPPIQFDVVITHFFFDMFDDEGMNRLVKAISASLSISGIWLVTDFVNTRCWHQFLLFLMYRFFWMLGAMRLNTLVDWNNSLVSQKFRCLQETHFYGGFMRSAVYIRGNS